MGRKRASPYELLLTRGEFVELQFITVEKKNRFVFSARKFCKNLQLRVLVDFKNDEYIHMKLFIAKKLKTLYDCRIYINLKTQTVVLSSQINNIREERKLNRDDIEKIVKNVMNIMNNMMIAKMRNDEYKLNYNFALLCEYITETFEALYTS